MLALSEVERGVLRTGLALLEDQAQRLPMGALSALRELEAWIDNPGPTEERISAIRRAVLTLKNTAMSGELPPDLAPAVERLADYALMFLPEPAPLQGEPQDMCVEMSPPDYSGVNLIESAHLSEAIPGSQGMKWKAVLITAGLSKNNRRYSPEVLKRAIPLFQRVRSFVDHPTTLEMRERPERSMRDLTGWFEDVHWDDSVTDGLGRPAGGLVATWNVLASGPLGDIVRECAERQCTDLIQFSIYASGKQRPLNEAGRTIYEVESIDYVASVDNVTLGAAGGRLLNLIASVRNEEGIAMDKQSCPAVEVSNPPVDPKLMESAERQVAELERRFAEAERKAKLAERQALLAERLAESKLPAPLKEELREAFSGRIFDSEELTQAIAKKEAVWQALAKINAKPRVEVTLDERDKMQKRLDGMIIGEDIDGIPRFRSLHQAFATFRNLNLADVPRSDIADMIMAESWGYDPRQANLRESISWSLALGTSMNRALIREYQIPGFDTWKLICSDIGDLDDLKERLRNRTGYYSTLPIVGEGASYLSLTSPDEEQARFTPAKRGGLEDYTWEKAVNDDLGALRAIPKKLALAALNTLHRFVFDMLANGDVTPTTYDAINLFSTTHANRGAGSSYALSSAALTAAKVAMASQTALGGGLYLEITPKYIVVPPNLYGLANQIIKGDYEYQPPTASTVNAVGQNNYNPHKDSLMPIQVAYWAGTPDLTNRWFLVADPRLVPTIEIGFLNGRQEPELLTEAPNTGSHFTADKIVFKIRHVYGGAPVDHRGLFAADPDWT